MWRRCPGCLQPGYEPLPCEHTHLANIRWRGYSVPTGASEGTRMADNPLCPQCRQFTVEKGAFGSVCPLCGALLCTDITAGRDPCYTQHVRSHDRETGGETRPV